MRIGGNDASEKPNRKMTKSKFLSDDRFGRLTNSELAQAGGNKDLALQRLLDDERDDSFEAVLDIDGETVWTAVKDEDGDIVRDEADEISVEWQTLADFAG